MTERICPWCLKLKPDSMPRETFNLIEQRWEISEMCNDCLDTITNEKGEIDQ